ncbi:patatin-like phospholipase family protein [Pumilibacter muris]|jgi:NTE family protein|uniref:patatin-like phospholipase family protein n=1 Tax=Pumilibacter muris TaxID=2941510 RepID=UPI00203C3A92|nr:patatin-like phospholipase family protein [Pumilibacter muris]
MAKTQRKKIGIALGSGGARGFCHIGVLQVLEENNIPIDCISGCSMGSIVGGCYCAGVPLEKLKSVAEKINQSVVLDINISYSKCGLVKGRRAVNVIKPLIGEINIEECPIPFRATATDVRSGTLKVFDSGKVIDAMRASMSIPVAFHAVSSGNEILVDGGILERIPIDCCKEMGADVVIAVDALGGVPSTDFEPNGLFGMLERSYLLMDWQNCRENIKKADLVIVPEQGNRSTYRFKDNAYSIECGRIAAEEMLPQIFEVIA